MARIDLARLDDLMLKIGELVTSRVRLEAELQQVRTKISVGEWRQLQEVHSLMGRHLRDLRLGLMRMRMVPVGEIFERMRFVVRDLARESGKRVVLDIEGEQTEIDKFVIERMIDPFVHLVRNAVSHGIESAEERVLAGKSPEGHIALRAYTVGESVAIEIEDDGRGIDVGKVTARARTLGLIGINAALENDRLFDIISAPGFSTREQADRESGRGVGMDVVKTTLQAVNGKISLATEPNQGTRFRIELSLTLAIADAFLATSGGQTFAVPQSVVSEVIEVQPESIRILENNELITHRGGVLPVIRLTNLFHLEPVGASENGGLEKRAFHAFVVRSGSASVALAVDRVLGQREVVVRAVDDVLVRVPGLAGATEVGEGRVILMLDVERLLPQKKAG